MSSKKSLSYIKTETAADKNKQQQPSTTKMYSNNNINDNREGFRLDSESYNEDDNRKF